VVDHARHNANFSAEHLWQLCRRQMHKAIDDDMFAPGDRLLVDVASTHEPVPVELVLGKRGRR
jgi:hypothetical protein